jgi:hypothetical protein
VYIYKHTIVVVAVLSVRLVYLLVCDINVNNEHRNQDFFSITATNTSSKLEWDKYFVKYIHILIESPSTKKRLNYKIWLLNQDITHLRKQYMPNIDKPHLVAYLSLLLLQINGLHTSTQ